MSHKEVSATRVGREWRHSRPSFSKWIEDGSEADQLAHALKTGRLGRRRWL